MIRTCRQCGREKEPFLPCVACLEVLAHDALQAVFPRAILDPSLICDCGQLREQCGHLEVV